MRRVKREEKRETKKRRKFKEEIGEIGLNASSLIPIIRQLINQ